MLGAAGKSYDKSPRLKLGIINGAVSAGGGERFLHGLVSGLLATPEVACWDITILLPRYNTAGAAVVWPGHLGGRNVRVAYLWDEPLGRLFSYLNASGDRFWGIPGSSLLRYYVPHLLAQHGPARLRGLAGNARIELELRCRQEGFDVAYFVWPHGEECPRLDVPLVMTIHDLHFKHGIGSPAFRDTKDQQMRDWLSRCSAFVVPSESILKECQSFYPAHAAKGRAIRHGIPQHPTTPTPAASEAYRLEKGLPAEFLLCAGWITPHKNQALLFEALGLLKARGAAVALLCVGPNSSFLRPDWARRSGPASDYVRHVLDVARAAGLEWQRDYFTLGYVDDFEMEHLYRLASALVMPTVYRAGACR
jgi:glycosyltransferase involved in cell wall biosynthesis